ncbi:MAG: tRNA pseudouridine(55) synthase TruB [Candidatus Colwellbacteria bacterium]|nr:tRNA pseudouridine(55) synthase TruB [Candidatus Colwellbacteria bacterium]
MILSLIKPAGISSHTLVNQIRRITGERKVGHGGTLDPLARGVLIVGVGRESTKQLQQYSKNTDKEYEAIIELGKNSSTDDSEGQITIVGDPMNVGRDKIEKVLVKFTGKIKQRPPKYSAIKIKGSPAYKLARRGNIFALPKRSVEIKSLELIEFKPPFIKITTTVSSGTYIRSLARDIGAKLKVGGYLKDLTRTRVGSFTLEQSSSVEDFAKRYKMSNTIGNEA